MKVKVTRKDILNNYNTFSCGYCDLQFLLHGENAKYYNNGVYGWNWDGYILNNVAIVTGYRNLCGKSIPYETSMLYEKKAQKIIKNSHNYDEQQELLKKLRSQFIETLKAL